MTNRIKCDIMYIVRNGETPNRDLKGCVIMKVTDIVNKLFFVNTIVILGKDDSYNTITLYKGDYFNIPKNILNNNVVSISVIDNELTIASE